jgi:hypothetical protein
MVSDQLAASGCLELGAARDEVRVHAELQQAHELQRIFR